MLRRVYLDEDPEQASVEIEAIRFRSDFISLRDRPYFEEIIRNQGAGGAASEARSTRGMQLSPSGSDGDGTRLGRHCYSRRMVPPVPPLAGLCSMDEARREGLSVDECVRRLKRVHYAFKRLHGIFNARLTSEPL